MFAVCPACGLYSEEKTIRPGMGWQAFAVCPECGQAYPFLRLPLFAVTGASGTGKSTLALALMGNEHSCIHLESDILWMPEFDHPEDGYHRLRSVWLRLCSYIGQTGRPVVLYGSVIPSQFAACSELGYFRQVHYLALVCSPEVLAARLRARPAWRNAGSIEFIEKMQSFNRWFLDYTEKNGPTIRLLDTSTISIEEAAAAIRQWIKEYWEPPLHPWKE